MKKLTGVTPYASVGLPANTYSNALHSPRLRVAQLDNQSKKKDNIKAPGISLA
jgi:hypothetical protein